MNHDAENPTEARRRRWGRLYIPKYRPRVHRVGLCVAVGVTSVVLLFWPSWNYTMRHRALTRPTFPYYTGAHLTTGTHIQGGQCPSNSTNIAGEIFGANVTAESLWPFASSASATRFAYVFYATEKEYLCSALVNFRQLRRVNVAGEIALIYPATWDQKYPVGSISTTRRLLHRAQHEYRVNLHPVKLWRTEEGEKTWSNSLTKLHIFGLTDYTRLIYLDSDALVLRNLDHLFLAPQARIALPRAYWLDEKDEKKLTSHIMVIAPSDSLMSRVQEYVKNVSSPPFDMEARNLCPIYFFLLTF
ncbi:unnamed protein product [Cyclocybe aegerita]|uniref:Glycosyltransferase family 8 protein n=1 Tax=Cyclocybe aegerita TaxID=1973307 RepID=A0A8S0Y0M4_CYCAE|nr:unnamed protein product [Cyclocybe aegerita]